jgi:hypothetical protein
LLFQFLFQLLDFSLLCIVYITSHCNHCLQYSYPFV